MMFDPPDYPYKDLTETLRDHLDPDDLLLNGPGSVDSDASKNLTEVTEHLIANVESQLPFHLISCNDSGRYFNVDNNALPYLDDTRNTNVENAEVYIVQPPDNLFNYEPTLLDENTVNQFLLPLKDSGDNNKNPESIGPDILALHSCVICHDIFTTDADLLDHTISVHASDNTLISSVLESNPAGTLDFEAEWLVCSVCQRVLSTALEVEPSEQLCCSDGDGKGGVAYKKLHTMYVCDCCSGLFADGDSLDAHRLTCFVPEQPYYADDMVITSPEILFSCDTCSKQFGSAEDLKVHTTECQPVRPSLRRGERRAYNSNSTNKMWNCGSCNQLFATARELYRHKRGEDRPPGAPLMAYVCEECDKVLGSMCALHTHKKMHKVSKPGYPCRVCGRRFNQSGHLAIHMRMHTGERPYPCDLCPKAFKVKVERDDHRRTHTGERPFACAACPKTFTAAARLREHARIHTDQRPYRCDICGAAFRRPYARTVHTLIHTGEKPHACDICGTAFRRSGDMWKHKRTLHGILSATEA
ncbi:zinc finger protein 888-like [Pectinophora gossypiella]|uniref:zinc finger protein 888-like n=1 Tax=Pectinophora gossypiella TaxID=13191 RepID=UPI00214E56F0|nr:zinc finger protein 888-like [Pectinophora gossypiella]